MTRPLLIALIILTNFPVIVMVYKYNLGSTFFLEPQHGVHNIEGESIILIWFLISLWLGRRIHKHKRR